jgi:hypothetical protein
MKLIVCGDFNMIGNPIPILENISGDEVTRPANNKKLDWILTNI